MNVAATTTTEAKDRTSQSCHRCKISGSMRASFFLILLVSVASVEGGRPRPFADNDFVSIAPGEFQMGCTIGDDACGNDEKPTHPVRITRTFQVQAHQVTRGQFKEVTGRGDWSWGKTFTVQVNWDDTQKFLKKLNGKKDGYQYRLLTEAEWEFVARNETRDMAQPTPVVFSEYGEGTGYGGGSRNDILTIDFLRKLKRMNCDESQKPPPCPQPGKPNARGLYDMLGDKAEWVEDWYALYSEGLQIDPKGPQNGDNKVVRGYNRGAPLLGMAYPPSRISYRSDFQWGFGFRCVREPRTN
jgi:formylglycine-generating enzyme required for sulfatase activity